MSYLYRVLRDSPVAFYAMDTSALTDATVYANNGTQTAATNTGRPIVANGIGSQQWIASGRTSYTIPNLMTNGKETQPFSLELWYKPENIVGTSSLLVRNNSGITHTSSALTFTMDFTGKTLSCSYGGLETGNNYHIVAVYDARDLYLYVNAVRVATAQVTADHLAAKIADTLSTIGIANSGSPHSFSVDGAAIYNYALDANTIQSHYNWGTDYPDVAEISARNSAHRVYRIWDGNTNLKARYQVDTAEEWNNAAFTGKLTVVDDTLTQQYDTTNSQFYTGTWQYSVYLYQEASTTLSGSRITWDANISNLDVKVSINGGTTWTAVTNGGSAFDNLDISTADKELLVKVTMPAGTSQIVVSGITVAVYYNKDIYGTNEDVPLLISDETKAVIAEYDYEPASFNLNSGAKFTSGTTGFSIPADAEFGSYVAVEFTMSVPSNVASKTLFVAGTATITTDASGNFVGTGMTALYINGVSKANGAATTLPVNQIHHFIAVFPATAGPLYLGNSAAMNVGIQNVRIGYVATYNATIAAADAQAIYGAWVGTTPTRWKETNKSNIVEHVYSETGCAMRGYSYTWSISGAS